MANAIIKWTVLGRSSIPDISGLPTRIQDIPKEILRMYGIIIDSEDAADSSSDDDVLVIDEYPVTIPQVRIETDASKFVIPAKPAQTSVVNSTVHDSPKKEPSRPKNVKSKAMEKDEMKHHIVSYCELCKKLVTDLSLPQHKKRHCFQSGCLDLILDEVDRIRHMKMHDHPTKPFVCKWCKKRYRFYCNVEKHHKVCKALRKAKDTWRRPPVLELKTEPTELVEPVLLK